ncbi:MAG: formate dehydrogenase accessory sulfurtransferase FdhD [Candidatus Bipolaricaulis sp.]|nr:formate dehydrogenase accessory sulfurtransferase FdhD [Candidatus Bipolaricaulis sp.]
MIKVDGREVQRLPDVLVLERRVAVCLGERLILSTVCSPGDLTELAYGHLLSEGWIRSAGDVAGVSVDADSGRVRFDVHGVDSRMRAAAEPGPIDFTSSISQVLASVRAVEAGGMVFRSTGGTHVAGLVCDGAADAVAEDISRTGALEKAFGKALLAGVDFRRSILVLTSRVPRSFIEKAARVGIPIVAAVSAPTYEAVEEAERCGICLCGFARGDRLNVYSRPARVGLP